MKQLFEIIWVRHFLIVIGILILWQIGAAGLRQKAHNNANVILEPRNLNSKLVQKGMTTLSTLDTLSLRKLQNLSTIIENRKEEKKQAFLDLYQYHFASATLLLIFSSISVILIFVVAQIGLNNANPFLKTVFYVLAALTSFYALSPLVYKQESNITKNLTGYLNYDNLQEEIYNYALTKPSITPTNDTLSFDKFHSRVINGMAMVNTIDFEFDYKAIPIPDFGLKK